MEEYHIVIKIISTTSDMSLVSQSRHLKQTLAADPTDPWKTIYGYYGCCVMLRLSL